ncbi:hypothetical protein INS49_007853 [Diaporthe citri]|uniref:uncharacterized protein n=1 Tax=Diaporthe citri TaxID=83186 RepID=UPI001C7F7928|nr:uncharacterized protein INS49_007853 [Diaporthe citri]KAG6362759.1 hypothetical protein INS49_007853 [Diaporthe citri]
MDTPKISIEKVQGENAPATTGEDKINTQQLNAMPAGDSFLKLVPEVAGGNMSTSANPTDPVLELRIQRAGASCDELDDEALELMEILRDYIFKTSEVTGILAGHPEIIAPFQYDLSMLDATSSFLASMLGPSTYGSVRPTEDQARRRTEIRNRCYRTIKQMRRIPGEQQEVDYAGQGGYESIQVAQGPQARPCPSIETRSVDSLAHSFSRILKFQLDGTDQEDTGTQEEQDQQDQREAGGSEQGGSRSSQSNLFDEVD